jgi:bifunctional non-homologous end joining protein LigD
VLQLGDASVLTTQQKAARRRLPQFNPDGGSGGHQSFVLDGEALLLDAEGISDFNALHSRNRDAEVQLYAFDRRRRPPQATAVAAQDQFGAGPGRRIDGIHVAPFEQGEIGPDVFAAICRMGLEGLVSKHRHRPYRPGRFDGWIKVKNRSHPAFSRVMN